jgi:hypothetical protein
MTTISTIDRAGLSAIGKDQQNHRGQFARGEQGRFV